MTMYPVMLQVAGRRCLVVGGGRVALRKVEGLIAAGADVTVIAPEIDARIEALSDVITIERRAYDAGDVTGFRLVITTTNDAAVNARVFDDAEAAGIWVNSADDIDHCSFTLPAVHRDGAVTVAVATDGQSPAFAAWLRDRVRDALPIGVGEIAESARRGAPCAPRGRRDDRGARLASAHRRARRQRRTGRHRAPRRRGAGRSRAAHPARRRGCSRPLTSSCTTRSRTPRCSRSCPGTSSASTSASAPDVRSLRSSSTTS